MDDDQEVTQAETLAVADEQSEAKAEAKEETPEAETEAKTETDADADGSEPEADDDEPEEPRRKPTGSQRLKEKLARAEAEIAQLRSRAPRDGEDMAKAIEREIGAPPKESDFSDYLAFERAMTAYTVKATLAEDRINTRMTEADLRQQMARREQVEVLYEHQAEVRKSIPDFDAVVSKANIPVAPHVEELVLESDKPALLQYHLAKRPKLVEQLNAMHPVRAAREVGRIERDLSLPKPKTETKAPPPVKPVRGSAVPESPDRDLDAWLNKQYGRTRRV